MSSVHQRVAEHVAAGPDRTALDDGRVRLTYGELDRLAGRLAARLDDVALPHDRPVAVALTDGVPTTVALLAIVRSGRFYVGLDPTGPPARMVSIASDAEPTAVVTEPRFRDVLASVRALGIPLVDVHGGADGAGPAPVARGPRDPMLLAYSSGTTGTPKGLLLPHDMHLHLCGMPADTGLGPGDRFGMVFSGALTTLSGYPFRALANGGTLLPFDLRATDAPGIGRWLERVTVLHAVPTMVRHLLTGIGRHQRFPALRVVYLTGEAATWDDVRRLRRLSPEVTVVHGVGASEVGPYAAYTVPPEAPLGEGTVPIGSAVPGRELLLRDAEGRPVPDGEIGSVTVRTAFAPLGYWRRPDLDAQVFEDVPGEDERLVHLSDQLVRRSDGLLEHRGRGDAVVKVEGSRVDLTDVETAIRALPDVVDAAVVQVDPAVLAAFVVPVPGTGIDASHVRAQLARVLPPVAVPARFAAVAELPRLAAGKVDRRALAHRASELGPPRRPATEAAEDEGSGLLDIWQELFPDRRVGPDDDWFELGGTSLLAARLVVAIERRLGVDLPVSALADAPTVRQLDRLLSRRSDERWSHFVPLAGDPRDAPPLFAFHALFGNVLLFHDLARELGPERPVVGVQAEALDGRRPGWRTIDELADGLTRALVAYQPEGPYLLFGQSFGGLLAFEVGRRLQAAGREVALVGMGDTMCPARPDRPPWRRGRFNLERYLRLDRRTGSTASWHAIRQAAWQLAEWWRGTRALVDLRLQRRVRPELRGSYARRLHLRATHRHGLAPAPLDVLLVRSSDVDEDERRGWGRFAASVTVRTVDAPHGAIVRPPHVAMTARYLRAAIDEALGASASDVTGP